MPKKNKNKKANVTQDTSGAGEEEQTEAKRRKVGAIQSVPPMDEITKLMECPICLDVLAGVQIFQCRNGHHLCGACKDKLELKNCPICRSPIKTTRNFGLESIADTFSFNCKYSNCSATLKGSEMMDHLKICEYRPFQCFETNKKNCAGAFVEFSEFWDHLKTEHEAIQSQSQIIRNKSFSKYFNDRAWNTAYIGYDGRVFLLHRRLKDKLLYIWMTMIGREAEAAAYSYQVKIRHYNLIDKKVRLTQTNVPMHSHHFGQLPKAEETGDVFCMSTKQLEKFSVKKEDNKYHWLSICEIFKN